MMGLIKSSVKMASNEEVLASNRGMEKNKMKAEVI
jgi:hypothetical protein